MSSKIIEKQNMFLYIVVIKWGDTHNKIEKAEQVIETLDFLDAFNKFKYIELKNIKENYHYVEKQIIKIHIKNKHYVNLHSIISDNIPKIPVEKYERKLSGAFFRVGQYMIEKIFAENNKQ